MLALRQLYSRPTGFSRTARATGVLLAVMVLGAAAVRDNAPEAPPNGAAEEAVQGLFITVPNPIDTKALNRVKAATSRFLQRPDHHGMKIIYDFNPDGQASDTSDYGPCDDLADFLLGLQDITTIAFVRNDVTGHTVLPVLACKEIVMANKALDEHTPVLGDVMRDQDKALRSSHRHFYEEVALRRGRRPALVLKMIDKEMEVLQGTRNGAVWYIGRDGVWSADADLAGEEKGFVADRDNAVILAAGSPGVYTAAIASKFGLCDRLADTRQEVAQAYRLPARSLRGDPLDGRTPNAWLIEIKGTVNGALKETLERRIRRAVSHQANFLILQLECGGGDSQAAQDLAEFLRTRNDDSGENPVMTVAYVTSQSRDTATFLALGCTEIVMDKDALLGGFEHIARERPQYQDAIRKSLEGLAVEQGYPLLLARGMLDSALGIHRVRSRKGPVERRLVDAQEKENPDWIDEGQIKAPGEWFSLSARVAEELGVAQLVVDGPSHETLAKIYSHYGLEKEQVRNAGPDWLDELAAFLCHPVVSAFLVMIGIAGLVLELKMPGVGLPGVVAALCFVLYFWAHSHLAGHLTMLALLLFILGLILIGLEVFVVPGFGITGVSGILLVMVSLALATLLKKPETTHEWLSFGTTLSTLGVGLVGAVVAAFVLAWYLPHIPYARRLLLSPPEQANLLEAEESGQPLGSVAELLGAIGVAATTLRPAGKARFGENLVDVVAECSYVSEGQRVQVVEIEGNRVVVKEL